MPAAHFIRWFLDIITPPEDLSQCASAEEWRCLGFRQQLLNAPQVSEGISRWGVIVYPAEPFEELNRALLLYCGEVGVDRVGRFIAFVTAGTVAVKPRERID